MPTKIIFIVMTCGLATALVGCDRPTGHEELLALDSHLDTPLVLDRAGFDIAAAMIGRPTMHKWICRA